MELTLDQMHSVTSQQANIIDNPLIGFHCSVLLIGWTALSIALLISGRYLIHITKHWSWIHIVSGSVITVGTVALEIALYSIAKTVFTSPPSTGTHGVGALLLGIICTIECGHGIYIYTQRNKPNNNDKKSQIHKIIHRILGWTTIALSMIANHSGVWINSPSIKYVYFAYYPIYAAIVFLFYFFLHRRAYNPRKGNLEINTIANGYSSVVDLNNKGGKYAFYENSVIDLKRFDMLHPGSKNFLDGFIGQELSRYIYGGLPCSIFNGHCHTKNALKLFISMKVAELANPTTDLIFMSKSIENKVFKIASASMVTPSFTCFKFVNADVKLRIMADGLNHIGKYYSLFSTVTGIGRNYCNSFAMSPMIYEWHIEAAKNYILGNSIIPKFRHISSATKDGVEMFIKKKNGFSKFVYDVGTDLNVLNNSFYIKGPFGGGLLLDDTKPQRIIFLSCGVGSIPIVDIASYILRFMISKSEKGALFTDEKMTYDITNLRIIMFSSFHSEKDVIGKEIFELVDKICQMENNPAFRYHLRLSERKDKYWDDSYFRGVLGSVIDINKVFISAPPALEKKLIENMAFIGIPNNRIEIM